MGLNSITVNAPHSKAVSVQRPVLPSRVDAADFRLASEMAPRVRLAEGQASMRRVLFGNEKRGVSGVPFRARKISCVL